MVIGDFRNDQKMTSLSSIGNYKLTPTILGTGSFSKVVLANHIILNKQVALKVVTLHKIKDPYVSKNLKREPDIMAKLNHPNIVSLHEVVSVGDFYCLVLDFYPGGNLCDMIGSQGASSCRRRSPGSSSDRSWQGWATSTARASYTATSSLKTSCCRGDFQFFLVSYS